MRGGERVSDPPYSGSVIILERWATSSRNGGRNYLVISGRAKFLRGGTEKARHRTVIGAHADLQELVWFEPSILRFCINLNPCLRVAAASLRTYRGAS